MSGTKPPRFRKDLAAVPTQADGVQYVDVRDARTGASFRFYDFEFAIAQQLDGRPLGSVIDWARQSFQLELTNEALDEFVTRLHELGFLETEPKAAAAPPRAVPAAPPAALFDETAPKGPPAAAEPPAALFEEPAPAAAEPPPGLFLDRAPPAVEPARPSIALSPDSAAPEAGPGDTLPGLERRGASDLQGIELSAEPASIDAEPPPPIEMSAEPPPAEMFDEAPASGPGPALEGSPEQSAPIMTELSGPAITAEVIEEEEAGHPAAMPPPLPRIVQERRQPPSPEAVDMAGVRAPRRALWPVLAAVVLVAGIASSVYYYYSRREAQPKQVRVMTPAPATVYRYFDQQGTVTGGASNEISFPASGKVTEVLPAGTAVRAGDVLGKLDGAAKYERTMKDLRARLAYYEQLAETTRAQGDEEKAKEAELKVAQKKKLITEAEDGMKALVLTATEPGEIVEVAVKPGDMVGPNTPVMKLKGGSIRAEFPLGAEAAEKARRLGFCRAELLAAGDKPAQAIECHMLEGQGDKLTVELPGQPAPSIGEKLKLARARFDGIFPVPRTALLPPGNRLFVARPDGRAEVRAVTVADTDGDRALISQGLSVGETVIVAPPADLIDGKRVQIVR